MKFSRKFLSIFLVISLLSLALLGCSDGPKEAKEPNSKLDSLTITHVTAPLNVPSILQKDMDVFQEEFKKNNMDIKIDYAEIMSGADQTQALASGDVDILYAVGATSVVLAAANGADIKVLNMYSRSPEAFAMYSKDSSLKTAQDLKGKTIAGPVGTNLHQLLLAYLKEANMTLEDVNYLNMSIPDAKAALDGGSIDVALLAGPIAYKAKEQGHNLLTDGSGLTDALIAVALRGDFYREHKEEVQILLEGQKKIIDYMDKNTQASLETVVQELDLSLEAVENMFQQYDFNIEVKEADRKALQNVADFMYESKMIDENIDASKLFLN